MKFKQIANRGDLDANYRDFEIDCPITENVMIEVLKSFNTEKSELYSATILTKDDFGHSTQSEYFGNDIYTAIKDKNIYPEFINAFYINKNTGHYACQVNMYLNSNKVHYIVSRKASRSFNDEKDLRDEKKEITRNQ